jgi:hypothetical protein
MEKYYGNHLGICINNIDPENRGRVQVFVPHIMPALYEGWNELGEDIKLECVGNNLPNGLSSKVVEKLTKILPWCEAAMPVIGNSVAGSYNPETGNFNQTNTPEAAATTLDLNTAAGAFALNGDPNASGAIANNVKLTYYSPTQETNDSGTLAGLGNSNNRLQPGIVALSPNLQQQYGLKNGDVVSLTLNNGVKHFGYVGDTTSSRLTDRFDVYLPGGSDKQLASTPGSGSLGSLRLEAAAPRRLTGKELDTQGPALLAQVTGRSGQTGINLNNPATAPDPSASGTSSNPFYTAQEQWQIQKQPTSDAVTQVNASTPVSAGSGKFNFNNAISQYGGGRSLDPNGIYRTPRGTTACLRGTVNVAGYITGSKDWAGASGIERAKDVVEVNKKLTSPVARPDGTKKVLYGNAGVINRTNYQAQQGDVLIHQAGAGVNGHAMIFVDGNWHSYKTNDNSLKDYLAKPGQRTTLFRLTEDGQQALRDTNNANTSSLGEPYDGPIGPATNAADENDNETESGLVKNPTETQATALDTTGMPQGMFGIPGPGAMLWVFFREGDPMFPVYFAASYGAAEWQSAYKASSPAAYGPQENNSNSISNQAVFRPNNAGALTFTGAVNSEQDSRAVRMAHANGGYLEFHPYGSVHYSPNEHLNHVGGTNYNYCINREEWTQGDDNKVVIGNQWVVVGNPSQANIETIEKLTEKVKQINAEMMKN